MIQASVLTPCAAPRVHISEGSSKPRLKGQLTPKMLDIFRVTARASSGWVRVRVRVRVRVTAAHAQEGG